MRRSRRRVLAGGWPTLDDSAGKVLFMIDNGGDKRDLYRAGQPSLEGRVMFTNATPGSPDAAFVKMNDPVGHVEEIQELVRDGYVVRTRSDEPTIEARSGDTTMRDAALASGAQWVSTDYPVPGISARFGSTYFTRAAGVLPRPLQPGQR